MIPSIILRPQFFICALAYSESLARSLPDRLGGDGHEVVIFSNSTEYLSFIQQHKEQIDCLIVQQTESFSLYGELRHSEIFLPTLVLDDNQTPSLPPDGTAMIQSKQPADYLPAAVTAPIGEATLTHWIKAAIEQFLQLAAEDVATPAIACKLAEPSLLMAQQRRLSEKLRERLGYLGVYYKRNPSTFLRHMAQLQKQELLQQLKVDYREILLTYFSHDLDLNERIDRFVNTVFLADVPVSVVVEIHMELMDEFSKQLKLEGRSDEVLLDYRLTLIDAIAHLCEMYRRSIPRDS